MHLSSTRMYSLHLVSSFYSNNINVKMSETFRQCRMSRGSGGSILGPGGHRPPKS